jgi:signal transduction histidine kinase
MISTNNGLSVMIVSGETRWTREIADYFSGDADALSPDAAWEIIRLTPPDAVIAIGSTEENDLLFRAIRDQFDVSTAPILILVTADGAPPFSLDTTADAVTPPTSSFIDWHLRKALQTRAERTKHLALQSELEQVTQQIDHFEKVAAEVDLLKNAIVRNVSHELRTPLLQVKSAVKLMTEDIEHPTLGNLALAATARLESVVSNITQLAQSMDELNIVPMLVRDCVNYALTNLRRAWEHKEDISRVVVHLDETLPPVMGDRQSISTALQMLIDNALKFSQDTVEVHAHLIGDRIEISVRDTGIGIPKNKLQVIFDAFFQIDSSSKRRYGGIGVGLSIVKMILERHNVAIQVESQEGKGSTFSFSLPIAKLD